MMDRRGVTDAILRLCREHPRGLSDSILRAKLSHISRTDLVEAINELLKMKCLQLFQDGSSLVYREMKKEEAEKLRDLTSEETIIYKLIEEAKNKGIWTRDLRFKGNMQPATVQRVLKSLEARKLVKCVKSVASKNKRVYMLADLEPSREVTGGAWYSDQEFDTSFVDALCQQCYRFVEGMGVATDEQTHAFVARSQVYKVDLTVRDVRAILDILVYKDQLEIVPDQRHASIGFKGEPQPRYRVVRPIRTQSQVAHVPCVVCPVFDECARGGSISPEGCEYLTKWLDLEEPPPADEQP